MNHVKFHYTMWLVSACRIFLVLKKSPIIYDALTCCLHFKESDTALLLGMLFSLAKKFCSFNHTFIKTIPIGVKGREPN